MTKRPNWPVSGRTNMMDLWAQWPEKPVNARTMRGRTDPAISCTLTLPSPLAPVFLLFYILRLSDMNMQRHLLIQSVSRTREGIKYHPPLGFVPMP
jgi:hypothetical protein